MEQDEAGAHARLKALRERLIDPKIAEHGGRIVKTAGDGMLLEFGSATAALRCAIDVQRAMAARNRDLAPDARIEFRIGINLGDIIVDGDDVAGDGVNIASRLETMAAPGGICIAAAVRDQVREDLDAAFVDLGEQQVKNIARPIRVFRVALEKGAAGASIAGPSLTSARPPPWLWPAASVAAASVIGIAAWLLPNATTTPARSPPRGRWRSCPLQFPEVAADESVADRLTRDVATRCRPEAMLSLRRTVSPRRTKASRSMRERLAGNSTCATSPKGTCGGPAIGSTSLRNSSMQSRAPSFGPSEWTSNPAARETTKLH